MISMLKNSDQSVNTSNSSISKILQPNIDSTKTIHRLNANWHLKNKYAKQNSQPNSTNSSTSFSSSSTHSTSTIVNNLPTVFDHSQDNYIFDTDHSPSPHIITDLDDAPKQFNNNIYDEHEEDEENIEYFYDENYELNTCDIDDNDKDCISFNVDFSNDPVSFEDNPDSSDNLRMFEKSRACSVFNLGLHSCEIDPKKYSLELSELSSESFTSSSSISSSSTKSNASSSSSFSSSITYYDDFYVSSKLKRDKQKQNKQVRHSSTFSMSKNLTYVSSYDRNMLKSSSSLKKYSLYANEINNGHQIKCEKNPNLTNSNVSLSILVDSPSLRSSSSSSSLTNIRINNKINRFKNITNKSENKSNNKNIHSIKQRHNNLLKDTRKLAISVQNVNKRLEAIDLKTKTSVPNNLNNKNFKRQDIPHAKNDNIIKMYQNSEFNSMCHDLNRNKPFKYTNENNSTISRQKQRQFLKDQQKQLKTLELNKKTITAVKQQEYLSAINNNQRNFNTNRSLCMARIHLLDDYLLVKIFSNLNTIDKLNLQFVCKKWYQIIWSSQNTYKLFNRIEISDKNLSSNLLNNTLNSTRTANTINSFNRSWVANSTITKFFCRKRKNAKTNKNQTNESLLQNKMCPALINADLVLKFLLLKLLNRQTYPLCLCVEHIVIKNNNLITDKGIDLITQLCPELKHLSLRNCTNIRTNSICKLISKCENLKYLDLTGCFNISNLVYLNGTNDSSTNKSITCFTNFSGQSAAISKQSNKNDKATKTKTPGITKRFTFYITNFGHKVQNKDLNQQENESSAPILKSPIINYMYLQFVDLSYCSYVNDTCIQNLCKTCPFIKNLYLRRCKLITDISLLHISKYCINLRELSLCQCTKLTDNGIRYLGINDSNYFLNKTDYNQSNEYINSNFNALDNSIGKNLSKFKIKYLSLAKCPFITDSSLIHLCKSGFFSQIKYLNLRGCVQVTDKFIKYFTGGSKSTQKLRFQNHGVLSANVEKIIENESLNESNIPFQLKSLDLAKCAITDKSIEYLCRLVSLNKQRFNETEFLTLQRLSLRCCENITDDGIKLLSLNCKNLQHLNVTKCSKITANSLKQIKINCQSCIVQHTNFSFC